MTDYTNKDSIGIKDFDPAIETDALVKDLVVVQPDEHTSIVPVTNPSEADGVIYVQLKEDVEGDTLPA